MVVTVLDTLASPSLIPTSVTDPLSGNAVRSFVIVKSNLRHYLMRSCALRRGDVRQSVHTLLQAAVQAMANGVNLLIAHLIRRDGFRGAGHRHTPAGGASAFSGLLVQGRRRTRYLLSNRPVGHETLHVHDPRLWIEPIYRDFKCMAIVGKIGDCSCRSWISLARRYAMNSSATLPVRHTRSSS